MFNDKKVEVSETVIDGVPETGKKAGTVEDREAMRRLGKQQVFKVRKLHSAGQRLTFDSETLVFFRSLDLL